jgi:hypothetical protein
MDMHNEPDVVAYLKKLAKERSDLADFKSSCLSGTVENGWPAVVISNHDPSPEVTLCQ